MIKSSVPVVLLCVAATMFGADQEVEEVSVGSKRKGEYASPKAKRRSLPHNASALAIAPQAKDKYLSSEEKALLDIMSLIENPPMRKTLKNNLRIALDRAGGYIWNRPENVWFGNPLQRAIQLDRFEIVCWLLQHGALPNVKDGRWSPLQEAVRSNRLCIAQKLLSAKADPNYRGLGTTALFEAVTQESVDAVNLLLKAKACPQSDRSDLNNQSLKELAMSKGHTKHGLTIMQLLGIPQQQSIDAAYSSIACRTLLNRYQQVTPRRIQTPH